MKTNLPKCILLIFIGLVPLAYQAYYAQTDMLSEQINAYQTQLENLDQSVKTFVNESEKFACWLSRTGELHSIEGDTSKHRHFSYASPDWKNVTFIEDFCLDSHNERIYFTDLMDLSSGNSAIKVSDRQGSNLRTLARLPGEIPYRLCLSPSDNVLFYLAKSEGREVAFRLRFINLKNGNQGTLYSSGSKIGSLLSTPGKESISIQDPQIGHLSFATDLESIQVLAEARQ